MILKSEIEKDTLILTMAKKLSYKNMEEFNLKLDKILEFDIENKNIMFDFDKLTAIDYFGLKQLIAVMKSIKEKKANILLVCLKPHLLRLFDKIGLNKVVPVL